MNKKKTMGINPLEAYLSKQENVADVVEYGSDISSAMRDEHEQVKKERITIHLPIDLINRIKNVVYWEPGMTLTAFAQEAFEQALQMQEEKRGEPYPERKERLLKSGRPVS